MSASDMAYVSQPYGLDFSTWASILTEQYSGEGMPEGIPPEIEWREWGERIQEVSALKNIPLTYGFSTWQKWAERVVESLIEEPTA